MFPPVVAVIGFCSLFISFLTVADKVSFAQRESEGITFSYAALSVNCFFSPPRWCEWVNHILIYFLIDLIAVYFIGIFALCACIVSSLFKALWVRVLLTWTVSARFHRSWELRTQKWKSHLVSTQSLNVLPFKPWVGQYIAIHATLTAREFFLPYFYPSSPFTCIFSKTSPNFFLCWPAE